MAGKLGVAKAERKAVLWVVSRVDWREISWADRKAVLWVVSRVDWKVFLWAESTVVLLALQKGMQKEIPRGFL